MVPVYLVSTPKGAGVLRQDKTDFAYVVCTFPSETHLSFFSIACLLMSRKTGILAPNTNKFTTPIGTDAVRNVFFPCCQPATC